MTARQPSLFDPHEPQPYSRYLGRLMRDYLDDPPYLADPPHQARDTSAQAAVQIKDKAPALRARVLAFICASEDGATDQEIQQGLFMPGSTERPRRRELELAGLIQPNGTRQTASGRKAIVWVGIR